MQVPCSHGAATALADFLVAKDANANVLVVEDNTQDIRGLVAVNSAVDAAVLLQNFDLSAYDGLLSPQEYEGLVAEAEATLMAQQKAAVDARVAQEMVWPMDQHRNRLRNLHQMFSIVMLTVESC